VFMSCYGTAILFTLVFIIHAIGLEPKFDMFLGEPGPCGGRVLWPALSYTLFFFLSASTHRDAGVLNSHLAIAGLHASDCSVTLHLQFPSLP
jgi:hypothetical protein